MVAKTYIQQNLLRIDRLYRGQCTPDQAQLLSKLATLELCGWIEVSMDDIALRAAMRLLKDPVERRAYVADVVQKVHGFHYDKHFRRLIGALIGLHGLAWMEKRVDQTVFAPMQGALASLKPVRDSHAHTYLKGATPNLDAPSVTLSRFQIVYAGLRNVEAVLRSFR